MEAASAAFPFSLVLSTERMRVGSGTTESRGTHKRVLTITREAVMNIFVGNLPFTASESDLRGIFAEYGEIESVAIITDRDTGRSRGFGFVEMSSADAAKNAEVRALHRMKEVRSTSQLLPVATSCYQLLLQLLLQRP